jgi:hypothetical protein
MTSGERLRLIFGFLTLLIIAGIAVMIATGKVEQESSYGLEPILVALTSVAASFCNWAFSRTESGLINPQKSNSLSGDPASGEKAKLE